MIKLRLGSKNDKDQVNSLFLSCGYKYKKNFWNYINQLNNKKNSSIICLLEFNNKIIGHYAFMKRNIYIDYEKIPICYASQVMIHPNFRGLKNIKMLIDFAQNQALSHGFKHIVGFPNRNIDKIYERFFNWELIYKNYIFKKKLIFNKFNNFKVTSIDKHNQKFFLSKFKNIFCNEFENDINAIKHSIFDNPHYKFDLIEIINHKKNINYLIIKYYLIDNKKIAHILYFHEKLTLHSLRSLENFLYSNGIDLISCWKYDFLNNEYVLDKSFYNTFYYKNLTETKINFKNFNLFMIDCDVYYF